MTNHTKLITIKIVHTVIWIFFNVVIFYMFYALTFGEIDFRLWIVYALIGFEVIILLFFKFFCPLTIMARKYSDSNKKNFDIYLPEWLARYNKQIYTMIMVIIIGLTIFRLV